MTGKDIDYEEILRQYKTTPEQAANDLERLILRGETPAPGSLALAVKLLRESGREKTGAELFEEIGYKEEKPGLKYSRKFCRTDEKECSLIYVNTTSCECWRWRGGSFLDGKIMALSPAENKAAEKVQEEMRAEDGKNHDND